MRRVNIVIAICVHLTCQGIKLSDSQATDTPAVVKTPKGSVVRACWYFDEMTEGDIYACSVLAVTAHPNANFKEPASRTYNCHAYAWYVSEGGENVWMGYLDPSAEDVYWTDGSYFEVTSEDVNGWVVAEKVGYPNGNHSAVTTTVVGTYKSKWGAWPLMEHSKADCPYNSTGLKYYIKSDGPAAEILGFSVVNGIARWNVETLYRTKAFLLEGRHKSTSTDYWKTLPIQIPLHLGAYEVDVGSTGLSHFRLVENETTGRRLVHGTARTESVDADKLAKSRAIKQKYPTAGALKTEVEELKRKAQTDGISWVPRASVDSPRMVIYTTNEMETAVTIGIADFWATNGYQVSVALVDGFPSDPNNFRSTLDAAIHTEAQNGASNFLLVGDANDYVEFSQPWPGQWEVIRQDYLGSGYPVGGQPDKDIIPSYVIPDTAEQEVGMSYYCPYWFTDQPYADLDGDDIPDVVVSRLPFTTDAEVYAYATKLWSDPAWNADNEYFLVGDRWKDGAGPRASDAAGNVMQLTPTWIEADTLYFSDCLYDSERNTLPAQLINTKEPELLVSLASWSNRYFPGDIFDKTSWYTPWVMDLITTTHPFVVVAASCGCADFARTEHPNYGLPVLHEFLAEPNKGAAVWIGPTAGSWQSGNQIVTSYLVEELFQAPFRPMGESFTNAIRRVLTDYADDPNIKQTARSYVFLGDPMIPFSGVPDVEITSFGRPVGVPDLQPTPENAVLGCPGGDEQEIVVFLKVDGDDISPPVPAEEIAIGQPTSGQVVFHETRVDSALTLQPNGDYQTTITISNFSGCGIDSALVTLYGYGVGYAVFWAKSPDMVLDYSSGKVFLEDLAVFGLHYPSSICNCRWPQTYSECANFIKSEEPDTTIDILDFARFASHYDHHYPSSPPGVSSKEVAYSNGSVELVFTEDCPLRGIRKLRGSVILKNVENYSAMFISFKNENPLFEFSSWRQDDDYASQTMCTEVTRNGRKEIVFGIIGGKNVSERTVNLGYFEVDVTGDDLLELSSEDFALATADLLETGGGVLTFRGASVQRTVRPTVYHNDLAQNYPNPFNPTTMIAFSIARDSRLELKIFDVRGALVKTLVNESRLKNNYKVFWDGKNNAGNPVASGVYFYRLVAGDFRATKKMVLLR